MPSVVIKPTTAILKIADLLDDAIHGFLRTTDLEPAHLGKYESEVETRHLLFLMVRNIEALLTLARTDLVLLPPACVLARAAFEIGLKAAWMVQPEDAYARELRWLVHLKEEERALEESGRKIRLAGGNGDAFYDKALMRLWE